MRTRRGEVRAAEVFLATNAYADGVDPGLRDRVLAMGSFIIATEPIDPASQLPSCRPGAWPSTTGTCCGTGATGRRAACCSADAGSLGRVRLAEARDHLYASMLHAHPQLAGTRVDRVWGGRVALTLDRLPHCGRIERRWYATGCNGSGVALNTWMGHRMAGAICGDPMPPFAELAHRRIPLRSLRRAWLPVVGEWFRAQDRLDR